MSELLKEVEDSFQHVREDNAGRGPLMMVTDGDEFAPGFNAMRRHYQPWLMAMVRRGYHHYAGSAPQENSDEALAETATVMMPFYLGACMETFCQGVLVGHQDNHLVKMAFHFDNLDHLYHEDDFRTLAHDMAKGFASDGEVEEFFLNYLTQGLNHISHIVGFAHQTDYQYNKVWDIWMLVGTAVVSSGYLAGHTLGSAWRERDVLRDIEIDLEEVSDGVAGEGD
jgi:hypothetical protein